MATVKENLIAAKALIDTPEKYKEMGGSTSGALYRVTRNWNEYAAAEQAYSDIRLRGIGHPNVMATFDRAIDAAE